MSTSVATPCPHCKRDLAANQRGKHCDSRTCTWLKCSCGAVVDAKRGFATHREHGAPCQAEHEGRAR